METFGGTQRLEALDTACIPPTKKEKNFSDSDDGDQIPRCQ